MPLKVVTINILGDLSRWELRRNLLVDELVDLSPDIIMIQEVSLPKNPAVWLSEQLSLRMDGSLDYKEYVCPKTGPWGEREGIGILSRIQVESYDCIPLGEQGRVAQKIQINWNNKQVTLANAHLFWQPGHSEERGRQVRKLINWSEKQSDNTPVVICGDFNATPDSEAILIMKERYQSAYESVHRKEPAFTYPTPLPVSFLYIMRTIVSFFSIIRIKSIKLNRRSVLDYIFINNLVKVLDCRLVFDNPHPRKAKIYPSDHYGLIAEVTSIQ